MNIHPHDGQSRGGASIDPITFEVIRHKLEAITEEQAITLKNVSGSPVVTEATDFNVGIYLADGAIVNVNGNNLQASYEGGDDNGLTLTVVP